MLKIRPPFVWESSTTGKGLSSPNSDKPSGAIGPALFAVLPQRARHCPTRNAYRPVKLRSTLAILSPLRLFSMSHGRIVLVSFLLVLSLLAVQLVEAGNATADGACGPLNGFGICGKASHCCSRYGYCGNGGSYCAQGCNPLYSYTIESCYPLPVCQSQTVRPPMVTSLLDHSAKSSDFLQYTFGSGGTARLVSKDQYNKVNPGLVDFIIDTGMSSALSRSRIRS